MRKWWSPLGPHWGVLEHLEHQNCVNFMDCVESSSVQRAQGLQIGLPPVLNFGTDEMKKRVAKSLARWKLPDELHRIHQKMESHELWLSFFTHFVLHFVFVFLFRPQTASWGTSGSSCETLPISFWVLGLQDFGFQDWVLKILYFCYIPYATENI